MSDLISKIAQVAGEAQPESILYIVFHSPEAFVQNANNPQTRVVGVDFFGDENGYDTEDRDDIDALLVGQTCGTKHYNIVNHSITRIR